MKPVIAILLMFSCCILAKPDDPFAVVEEEPIDRTKDKKSNNFISDKLLKAFGEKRLDKGTGKKRSVIRITIMRSFHAPLLLKWYPAYDEHKALIHIKRLKVKSTDTERIYEGLDIDKRIELKASQEKLLKAIYRHSPIQDLPQDYWSPQTLDGSMWIYEASGGDGSTLLTRRNPIDLFLEGSNIKSARLARELQLTTFSLMLWTLSDIDEEPY